MFVTKMCPLCSFENPGLILIAFEVFNLLCSRLPAVSVLVRLLGHSENQQNAPYYQVKSSLLAR